MSECVKRVPEWIHLLESFVGIAHAAKPSTHIMKICHAAANLIQSSTSPPPLALLSPLASVLLLMYFAIK